MTEKNARWAVIVFFTLIVLLFLIHGFLIYNIPANDLTFADNGKVPADAIPVLLTDTSYPNAKLLDTVIREMSSFYLVEDAGELHLLGFRMHPYSHRYQEYKDILVPREGSYSYDFYYSFAFTTLVITDGVLEEPQLGLTITGGYNTFIPLIAYSGISLFTTVIIFKIFGKIKKKEENNT